MSLPNPLQQRPSLDTGGRRPLFGEIGPMLCSSEEFFTSPFDLPDPRDLASLVRPSWSNGRSPSRTWDKSIVTPLKLRFCAIPASPRKILPAMHQIPLPSAISPHLRQSLPSLHLQLGDLIGDGPKSAANNPPPAYRSSYLTGRSFLHSLTDLSNSQSPYNSLQHNRSNSEPFTTSKSTAGVTLGHPRSLTKTPPSSPKLSQPQTHPLPRSLTRNEDGPESNTPLTIASSLPNPSQPQTLMPPIQTGPAGVGDSLLVHGGYKCEHPGCTVPPFQTQYLLNSHAYVHSQYRPHYCPVKTCSRSDGGRGFKRKNEMIRHGLVHQSPGYICPFCTEREHKYPRPDNLQRHVRIHHLDKDKDDPKLRVVLSQPPKDGSRGRRRRVN